MNYKLAVNCRMSGEKLSSERVILDIKDAPLPGLYPKKEKDSLKLRTPLQIVQAEKSKLVQLAHIIDDSVYKKYSFKGNISNFYCNHLKYFVKEISDVFGKDSHILEIGAGDGTMLDMLHGLGYTKLCGIDPSLAASECHNRNISLISGYFPHDLPAQLGKKCFDLIIIRHVLEHINDLQNFLMEIDGYLSEQGQLWVEVPDLNSTLSKKIFTNFHQLHCNYFTEDTLDTLFSSVNLFPIKKEVVGIYGGSLLHRYSREYKDISISQDNFASIQKDVDFFSERLSLSCSDLPGKIFGYGAAERTASFFGICPSLEKKISHFVDGNNLLWGRYMGGTQIPISPPSFLKNNKPGSIILFAVSHANEIVSELRHFVSEDTPVLIANDHLSVASLYNFIHDGDLV